MNGKYLYLVWVSVILAAINGQQQNMDVLFEKFLQHTGRKNMKSQGLNNINMQDPASLPVMYTLFKQIMQFSNDKNPSKSATNTATKQNQVSSSQSQNSKSVFSAMKPPKATGMNSQQNFKFKPKRPSFTMPAGSNPKHSQNTNSPATNKNAVSKKFNTFPTNSPSFPKRPVTQQSIRTSVTKPPMPNPNGQNTNTATMWGNVNSRSQQHQQQRFNTQTRPRTFREFSSQKNSPSSINTGSQMRQPSTMPNNFNQAPMNFGQRSFGNNARFPPLPMNPFQNFQNPGFMNFPKEPQTPPTPETLWGNFGNNGGQPNPQNPMNNNNNNMNNNDARMVSNPASEQTFEQFLLSMAQGMMGPNGPMQSNGPKNTFSAPKPNTFTTPAPPTTPTPAPTTPAARATLASPTISNPATMPGFNNNNQGMGNLMPDIGPNMNIAQLWDTLLGVGSSNNVQSTGSPNVQSRTNNIRPPNVPATTPMPPTTTLSPPPNFPLPNINSAGNFGTSPSGGRTPGSGGPPNMGGPPGIGGFPNMGGNFNMQNMRNMLQMMIPLEYFVQDPVTGTFAAEQIEMLTPTFRRIRSEGSGPGSVNVEIFIDKGTSMGEGIFMFESTKCYIGVVSENKQYLAALQNVSQTVNPGQVLIKENHVPFTAMEVEPLTFAALRRISPMIANECEGKPSVYIQPAGMLPPSPRQKCFATAAAEYCIQPPLTPDYFRMPSAPAA